jgi:archaemetzincin
VRNFIFILLIGLFSCQEKSNKIALQVFETIDAELKDSIASSLKNEYKAEIVFLAPIPLPANTFTNVKSPRYRADKLLQFLKTIKPADCQYIIGITNRDISTTKRNSLGMTLKPAWKYEDWGVFGLGYVRGPACVVSSFRIKNCSKQLLISRMQKISIHEIGHNMGLLHCTADEKCVMQDAVESVKTVDKAQPSLCKACRLKI